MRNILKTYEFAFVYQDGCKVGNFLRLHVNRKDLKHRICFAEQRDSVYFHVVFLYLVV